MKKTRQNLAVMAALSALFTILVCSLGTPAFAETADPKLAGIYDLILYGCRYPHDIEHAAFLITPDKSGKVELFVPATSYKIKRGLPADQAMAEAKAHVRCGVRTVESVRVQQIPDGSGGTLGFEVLPRYPFTDVGGMDPVNVNYEQKDGKTIVYIRLSPAAEQQLKRSGVQY